MRRPAVGFDIGVFAALHKSGGLRENAVASAVLGILLFSDATRYSAQLSFGAMPSAERRALTRCIGTCGTSSCR